MSQATEKAADDGPGTAVVNIEEQIKKNLAKLNERVGAPPSNKISTKGKRFTLPGGEPRTDPLQVVVLDYIWVMAHYPGAYNPKQLQDPDCFAIGRDKPESGLLLPHDSIAKPRSKDCNSCTQNAWGSAPNGPGKACKNQRRLLVVPHDAGPETQPLTIYVSPSAIKNFDAYLRELATVEQMDPIQVVTIIDFDPNETYSKLTFKMSGKHANLNEMWALRQRYESMTERPIELKGDRK